MDYSEQIFAMLGVQPYESFKISFGGTNHPSLYRLDEHLTMHHQSIYNDWVPSCVRNIQEILIGKINIVKISD